MTLARVIERDPQYHGILREMPITAENFDGDVELKFLALREAIREWINMGYAEQYVAQKRVFENAITNYLTGATHGVVPFPSLLEDLREYVSGTKQIVSDLQWSFEQSIKAHLELVKEVEEDMRKELGISTSRLGVDPYLYRAICLSDENLHWHIQNKRRPSLYDFRLTQQEINRASLIYYISEKEGVVFFKVRSEQSLKNHSLGLYGLYKKHGMGYRPLPKWKQLLNKIFG